MTRTCAAAVATLLFALARAGSASAQEAPESVEADARERFERGVEALNRGSFDLAAEYFEGSFERSPRAPTMCNLALTFDRWGGHECDAWGAYTRCAELDRSGRFRDHAVRRADELQAAHDCEGASPDATPPDATPPDATPAPPPTTSPWHGAPIASPFATPAPDVATVEARDPIVIGGPHEVDTPSRSHGLLVAGIVAGLGAGGALAGGILLAQSAGRDVDDLWNRYPDGRIPAGTADADQLDSARTARNLSVTLYVAAGVLGAGSLALVIFDLSQDGPESARRAARRTELLVSPTGATLRGTF